MKKRMRVWTHIFLLLLAGVLWMSSVQPMEAASVRTVKVGIFSLGQFQYLDEKGEPGGYNQEYLDRIAKVAHWKYEFVRVENWVDATEKLEKGEIDLLAPAQKIDSLTSRFDYAAYTMGMEFGAIYTPSDRHDLLVGDYEAMEKLTFGLAQGSTFSKQFLNDYCVEADIHPATVYYNNTTELFDALQRGEVDAVVTNIMFAQEGLKLLGRFTPLPVYYITTKGNEELLKELNEAMMSLRFSDPSLETELMTKYFPVFQDTEKTYEEARYVKEIGTIKIGYEVNHAPLSYEDKDGEFAGITRDILDRISEITGIPFAYTALPAADVTSDYLNQEGIQVLAGVEYNQKNLNTTALNLSSPYLESEKVMIAKEGFEFDEEKTFALAVSTGSVTLKDAIGEEYPKAKIQTFETVEECFDAVKDGTADVLLLNRYVAEAMLDKPAYSDMSILPVQSLEDNLCLATFQLETGNDERLTNGDFINVVDKAVKQITKSERNTIILTNTSKARYKLTITDFAYQYRYTLLMVGLMLLLCVFLVVRNAHLKAVQNQKLEQKNRELTDAVNMATHANKAKSQFLSRMSHEIRTPMNAIVGITTIAKSYLNNPEKMNAYLGKIDVSSKVLLSIINDVLDMSAIENDKIKIAHSEFDMKQVLNGITAIYYPQCKDKGVHLIVAADIEEEVVIGDSLRVSQVLMNLVSNAYKFTEKGGRISILISQTRKRNKTVFFRFTVSDTGCGMSQEMQERLFKPFEQESADTAMKHGGSGLGMSIAKNLVDLLHGAIKVESEKGKGTTFTVDLPFEMTGKRSGASLEHLKEVRALVIDDDADAREYTSVVLDRIGVQYDVVVSGEEALLKMEEEQKKGSAYDICFVDWKMPDLNGVEVTREIRKRYSRDMVIIIVSAYDLSEVEDEAKLAGADLFVPKPLFQSTVFNLLMNLTGGRYVKNATGHKDYDFSGYKVLVAEDNELNAEIAGDLLGLVKMDMDRAEDGKKAVEMFASSEEGTYAAILMDIQMPEMDGYEATRCIRASNHIQAKTIPIYAMTANAFDEDVTAALSCGMDGHLAKPVDAEALYETLEKIIEESQKV